MSGKRWVSSGASFISPGPDKHAAISACVLSPSAPPGGLRILPASVCSLTAPGTARAAPVRAPVRSAQFGVPARCAATPERAATGPWSSVKSSPAPPEWRRSPRRRQTRSVEDKAGVPDGYQVCAGSESSGDPSDGSKSRAAGDSSSENDSEVSTHASSKVSAQALCGLEVSADVPDHSR